MLLGKLCSLFDGVIVHLCMHMSAYFCRCGQLERLPSRLSNFTDICCALSSFFPHYLPLALSFHFIHPSWHRPIRSRAKRSVSEEGHPLGMVFGTNTAAAFPLLYPSADFGPLLWTTAQIWPVFSKHACTAARPLYTGLLCNYCQQQLNMGMYRNSGLGQ